MGGSGFRVGGFGPRARITGFLAQVVYGESPKAVQEPYYSNRWV